MELLCRGLKSWEGRRGEGRRESSTDWHSFPRITWCVILYVWSQLIFYFSWKLIRSIDKGDRAPLARSGVAPSSCKVKNNHSQPRRHMLTWGVSRKGWRVVFWFAIQATRRVADCLMVDCRAPLRGSSDWVAAKHLPASRGAPRRQSSYNREVIHRKTSSFGWGGETRRMETEDLSVPGQGWPAGPCVAW